MPRRVFKRRGEGDNPFKPNERGYYLWIAWHRCGRRGEEPRPGSVNPSDYASSRTSKLPFAKRLYRLWMRITQQELDDLGGG
jgi:hypothetical protein